MLSRWHHSTSPWCLHQPSCVPSLSSVRWATCRCSVMPCNRWSSRAKSSLATTESKYVHPNIPQKGQGFRTSFMWCVFQRSSSLRRHFSFLSLNGRNARTLSCTPLVVISMHSAHFRFQGRGSALSLYLWFKFFLFFFISDGLPFAALDCLLTCMLAWCWDKFKPQPFIPPIRAIWSHGVQKDYWHGHGFSPKFFRCSFYAASLGAGLDRLANLWHVI